ncbi:MAG: hypothetical protein AB8H03_05630 [Saprospiraceae bacterium]
MKIQIILICLGVILFQNGYAQKKTEKSIYTSSSINYYPALKPYSFINTFEQDQRKLALTFLSSNSGNFVIDTSTQTVKKENINKFPTQNFNIGMSIRVSKDHSSFHEISLSRFSRSKSSYNDNYVITDTLDKNYYIFIGYEQKSFILSLRYEYGKMFGYKKNNFRFGLSGFFEPTFYSYSREVNSSRDFPIKATIFSFSVGVVPSATFKLSKRVSLDLKVIPRILLGEFSNVTTNNPTLSPDDQKTEREFDFPEVDIAGSIQIRYLLKETKKRRK